MADLKIADAPELTTIGGDEKIPTGNSGGNFSIVVDALAQFVKDSKDLQNSTEVDAVVAPVEMEVATHVADLANPHQVTKEQVGLSNVDNTADADKPISNAVQSAITTLTTNKADKTYVDSQLATKSDKLTTYTKTEVDNLLIQKANQSTTYTKVEVDTKLSDKQEKLNVDGFLTGVNTFSNVPNLDGLDGNPSSIMNQQAQALMNRTENLKYQEKTGLNYYDPSFSTSIGGYPTNSKILLLNGTVVTSTVNNNLANPNSDMTGWKQHSFDSVLTVAEMLSLSLKDGFIIHVKSYNAPVLAEANPYKGGGYFVYDSTKSGVNNGVTIINGWVRIITDKHLTTEDAGLKGDGTDTNITTRLQSIADAVGDGFTVDFIGNYATTTNIYFNNKQNLTLRSVDGSIVGDKANWVFGAPIAGTNRRGLLVFKDCHNLKLHQLVVTGVQKNIFGSFQDGDSCIQMIQCNNPDIRLCTLTNCFAWTIVGEGCLNPTVEYNVIADVTHQSGINVVVGGGKNAHVNFNYIYNVGLYGAEFETYTVITDDNFECIGNTIVDCFAGVTATGTGVTRGSIIGNTIRKSGYSAIWMKSIQAAKSISIFNNTCEENYRFAVLNTSPNTTVSGNTAAGRAKTDLYLKINPDYFVLKVLDANNFLIHNDAITGTGTIYINGIAYTVTAVNSYSDVSAEFEFTTLKRITVSQTINDALVLNKHLQRIVLSGFVTEASVTMLEASDGLIVRANTISGSNYGCYYNQAVAPAGSPKQYFYDNTILDFGINAILHTVSTSHVFYKGNKVNSLSVASYNINDALITNGSFATKSLKMIQAATKSSGGVPVNRFGMHKQELILAAHVSFYNGTTTGSAAIKFNEGSTTITSEGTGAPTTGRFHRYNAVLPKGLNTVEIMDTVGDLAFTNAWIDVLVPE